MKIHEYKLSLTWTGNEGKGTADLSSYKRSYQSAVEGKPILEGSADPSYMGDPTKWNPEEMLLSSVASCQMLWYLGLCAMKKIAVTKYKDSPEGVVTTEAGGGGTFTEIILRPQIEISDAAQLEVAKSLHEEAHKKCFVANSLNCPIKIEPTVIASS